MAVPQNRADLLTAINGNFEKLLRELADVPAGEATAKTLEGHARGTMMSVSDLVAYLTGWNELVLKWLDRDAAGQAIDFPETGFKWNELGALAGKFYADYADYADLPYPRLLKRLETAKACIVSQVEARSDEELYGRPWYGKWTMGRMIQFNTASPYANARGRLRKWKKAG